MRGDVEVREDIGLGLKVLKLSLIHLKVDGADVDASVA